MIYNVDIKNLTNDSVLPNSPCTFCFLHFYFNIVTIISRPQHKTALLHSQRVVMNFLHLLSKWSFQVSLLSRITPRYLARLQISRRCPFSSSVLVALHLYRLLKMTTSTVRPLPCILGGYLTKWKWASALPSFDRKN